MKCFRLFQHLGYIVGMRLVFHFNKRNGSVYVLINYTCLAPQHICRVQHYLGEKRLFQRFFFSTRREIRKNQLHLQKISTWNNAGFMDIIRSSRK